MTPLKPEPSYRVLLCIYGDRQIPCIFKLLFFCAFPSTGLILNNKLFIDTINLGAYSSAVAYVKYKAIEVKKPVLSFEIEFNGVYQRTDNLQRPKG